MGRARGRAPPVLPRERRRDDDGEHLARRDADLDHPQRRPDRAPRRLRRQRQGPTRRPQLVAPAHRVPRAPRRGGVTRRASTSSSTRTCTPTTSAGTLA
ncbi:hypothetical protein NKG05_03145 [Oerskovia sp. M15]